MDLVPAGRFYDSLPPANEVWGKVIFSVACVKAFLFMNNVSAHRGFMAIFGTRYIIIATKCNAVVRPTDSLHIFNLLDYIL